MAGNKHVEVFVAKHLKPGEAVLASAEGYIGNMLGSGRDKQRNGVLLVTGERVVFYRSGLLGEVIESIPLKTLTSIERKSTMGHRSIRLHTSHDALEFKTFDARGEQELMAAIEQGRTGASVPPVVPDGLGALKSLAELHAAGVLTDSEFASKKAEILARL